jgi:hypothetical protein
MGMIWDGVNKYLLVQKVKNTPTSKARSVALGMTEVFGNAKCKTDMLSPVARQKSVYYKIKGEYYYSAGKHSGWRTLSEHTSHNPFYIEDETGKILIDPRDATIDIPSDFIYQGYITGKGMFGIGHTQLDKKALDFIGQLPPLENSAFMRHQNENIRITEYFIAENDQVYVLGTAEQQGGAASSIGYENLVIKMGRDNVMYISDSAEKKVIDKLSSTFWWEIPVGLALAAVCLFVFILMMTGSLG